DPHGLPTGGDPLRTADHRVPHLRAPRTVRHLDADPQLLEGVAVLVLRRRPSFPSKGTSMKKQRMLRPVAGVAVATLVLTGCRGGGDDAEGAGPGITAEPCPDAVNEDNGCIYLGAISDLTKGPFAPLAGPITDAQKAFWQRVNEDGGVGGYDVNITDNIADSEYNPEIHNRKYQEMRKDILALGQTLGSSQTLAILDDMKSDDVIGVPASWNSAWDFEDQILQ